MIFNGIGAINVITQPGIVSQIIRYSSACVSHNDFLIDKVKKTASEQRVPSG